MANFPDRTSPLTQKQPSLSRWMTPLKLGYNPEASVSDLSPRGPEHPHANLCFRVFIVVSIVLALVVVVTAILAIMASKGLFPDAMASIHKLSVIGEVNSYVMLGGGLSLFILGVVAYSCLLFKQVQSPPPDLNLSQT